MRPFPTLLALVVTSLAGCGDPVETPGLAGEWTGTTDEVVIWTFNFEDRGDTGDLMGTVLTSFGGSPGPAGIIVSGTYEHPSVTLDFRLSGNEVYPHMEYYGTVDDGMDLMEGSLVIDEVTYPLNLTRAQ